MGLKARLGLALTAIALAAAPSSAQQWVYYNACGTPEGSTLRVCASADVSLIGTTLVMRVWNMETEGASGVSSYYTEFGGWHTITSVGLEYTGSGRSASGDLTGARYVFGEGAADYRNFAYWRGVEDDGVKNPLRVEIGSSTDGHREGIVGCTDPFASRAGHVMTCNSYGFMPYAEFTFSNVSPDIHLAKYNFEFYGWQIYGGQTAKVSAPGVPTEVVPEPITMVLLGSGLLGVGGVGLRRRRKNQLEGVA